MPTKAELEAELAELRKQIAGREPAGDEAPADDAAKDGPAAGPLDWALSQIDGSEAERLIKEFVAELGDLQDKKPLMTLFGAFLLGYLLGRAR